MKKNDFWSEVKYGRSLRRNLKLTHQMIVTMLILLFLSSAAYAEIVFEPAQPINVAVTANSNAIVTADFDGDGCLDFARTDAYYYGRVLVTLGNCDGTFQPEQVYYIPLSYPYANSYDITAGDYDGDGKTDLAVTFMGGREIAILTNNGGGIFTPAPVPAIQLPGCWVETSIASGDFDNDGDLDLVNSCRSYITIYTNDGLGNFSEGWRYIYYGYNRAFELAVGDLDGDGNLDLAAGVGYKKVDIFLGNGDGTLSYKGNNSVTQMASSIKIDDFNNDGIADLVGGSNNPGNTRMYFSVLIGNGDGSFQPYMSYRFYGAHDMWPIEKNVITTGDFNGDCETDIVVLGKYAGLGIYAGNGDGTFIGPTYPSIQENLTPYAISIVSGDFNGDGKPDIVTGNWSSLSNSIFINKATSICGPAVVAGAGVAQTVEQTSPAGAEVALDGSLSEGDDLTYEWTWAGGSASGVNPTVTLLAGDTEVTLTVTSGGDSATDTAIITVEDTIAPTASALTNGTPGNNGWYVSDVTVTILGSDSGSGVKEIRYSVNGGVEQAVAGSSAVVTITNDGLYSVTYRAVDDAGNSSGVVTTTGKIDKTAPVVTITAPVAGDYPISEVLTISYAATDATSGVISSSAALDGQTVTNGQAVNLYELAPGSHTFTVSAGDAAGNSAAKNVTFNVIVTADSLADLIQIFLGSGEVGNGGTANSLTKQLDGPKQALLNHIDAQEGQHISTYAADILRAAIAAL